MNNRAELDMRDLQTNGYGAAGEPALVIGAGPAGLAAAFQLGLRGFRPVIVDSLERAGGQLSALYPAEAVRDAPGLAPLPAEALAAELEAQLRPFAPLRLFGRRATAIWGGLEGGFNVETDTGETIWGAAAIFAGGLGAMRPKRLVAEGIGEIAAADLKADSAGRRVAIAGDGPEAVAAALEAAGKARAVTLIHAFPVRADEAELAKLRAAAEAGRISALRGEVARVRAEGGRLSGLEVEGPAGRSSHDVDLLLVRAGLEFAPEGVTGLGPIADHATGETTTPGVFVVGDARAEKGRPAVIAAAFSEAVRAAEALAARVAPKAPRALPHLTVSPTLRSRLAIA